MGIYIGTSGWHYVHWSGPFYPPDLPKEQFLKYYSNFFRTAEINSTFYHLPYESSLSRWRESVPADFVFAVKASRFITHMKKLGEPEKSLPPFLESVKTLGTKLGPVLFQLPPHWHLNLERFKGFLKALPEGFKYVFEFRDPTWFNAEVDEALRDCGAVFCIWDLAGSQSPRTVTAKIVYVRLHGPEGAYQGQYSDAILRDWAGAIAEWASQNLDIYCYFDNDEAGYAPQDALRLKTMLGI